jgi:hypothetical protein
MLQDVYMNRMHLANICAIVTVITTIFVCIYYYAFVYLPQKSETAAPKPVAQQSITQALPLQVLDNKHTNAATVGNSITNSALTHPSATIDQDSLSQRTNSFIISGTEQHADVGGVATVFLIAADYDSSSEDYNAILRLVGEPGVYNNYDGYWHPGVWAAIFSGVSPGTYIVLAYDGTSHTLLARRIMYVSSSSSQSVR